MVWGAPYPLYRRVLAGIFWPVGWFWIIALRFKWGRELLKNARNHADIRFNKP